MNTVKKNQVLHLIDPEEWFIAQNNFKYLKSNNSERLRLK